MLLIKLFYRKFVLPSSKAIKGAILWPYYFVYTSNAVWRSLNKEAVGLYENRKPNLDIAQKRIVADLKKNGVALTHLDELFPGQNLLSKILTSVTPLVELAKTGRKKKFLDYIWKDGSLLDLENPLLNLAIDEKILNIVNSYLEMYSKLRFFSLTVASPIGDGADAEGSQKWHRDPGIKRICKMFIYLNGVDEETGPFIYIAGSHSQGRWWKLFPQILFGREGYYPPPGALEKTAAKKDIKVCTGKAGTIIFCDTLGLHKGGYATKKKRIMFTALYKYNVSKLPPQFEYPNNFEEQRGKLSVMSRYALKI